MRIIQNNLRYIVIAIGIVLVWRGIWGLADIYLFPYNEQLSFVVSILTGIVILFIMDIKKKDISELE